MSVSCFLDNIFINYGHRSVIISKNISKIKPKSYCFRMFSTRNYDTSGNEGEYDSYEGEGDSSRDEDDKDAMGSMGTTEACLCVEESQSNDEMESEIESVDADDLFTVYVGIEEADPFCAKIHDLLQKGKISKDRIFYKYVVDVVEIMYNPFHEYDREFVEFFNTITYLGSKRTTCFIRGPMNLGDGRNSCAEEKMNLGGPSESVCEVSSWIHTRIGGH